jgi:RHS repeat-associated protein
VLPLLLAVALLATWPGNARAQRFELPGTVSVNQIGAATYNIPIATPPGTAGMTPSLSLNYNSQGGDGSLGVGWSLGGLSSITRCPQTVAQDGFTGGVNNDANDRFCLDGQRLLVISGTYGADGAEYRTEIESYSRVFSHGATGTGPTYFTVQTKSGLTMEYGNTTDSRLLANSAAPAMVWGLDKVTDHKGNYYTVTWWNDPSYSVIYPVTINYTGNASTGLAPYNSINLAYGLTPSGAIRQSHQGGVRSEGALTLTSITTTATGSGTVNIYTLDYAQSPVTERNELTSVQRCDGSGNCLPTTNFGWPGASGAGSFNSSAVMASVCAPVAYTFGDFNGDGKTDAFCTAATGTQVLVGFSNGDGTFNTGAGNQTVPCNTVYIGTGDFDGDGKTDAICNTYTGMHTVLHSNGDGTFTTQSTWGPWCDSSHIAMGDYNGDGKTDLICNAADGTHQVALSKGDGTFTIETSWGPWCDPAHLSSGDFNGDGKLDLFCADASSNNTVAFSNGDGSFAGQPSWGPWCPPGDIALGDFDGDGKTDLVCNGTSENVAFSNGNGTFDPFGNWPSSGSWCASPSTVRLGDFNGDGRTDLICYDTSNNYKVAFSDGFGNFIAQSAAPAGWCPSGGYDIAGAADLNGDGRLDLVCTYLSGSSFYSKTALANGAPDKMTSVTSGLGAVTSITWTPTSVGGKFYYKNGNPSYPTLSTPGGMNIVSSVVTDNGVGGTYTLNYSYSGALTDLSGHGFLGFNQTFVTDPQKSLETTTTYNQSWPYTGTTAVQTINHGTTTLSQATNYYSSGATTLLYYTPRYVEWSSSVQTRADLDGTALPTVNSAAGSYDSCGNPGTQSQSASDNYGTSTTITLPGTSSDCSLDKPSQITVKSTTPSENVTRTSSFLYDSGSGILTQQTNEPGSSTLQLQTTYTLNAYGEVTNTQVSGIGIVTRSSSVTYDGNGRFVTSATNAAGQTTTSLQYDSRFGGITSETDPNGLTTSWTYDMFGRVATQTNPDSTVSTTAYVAASGCPSGCYAYTTTTGRPSVLADYDKLERLFYTWHQNFDSSGVAFDKVQYFDAYGRIQTVSQPYFTTASTVYYNTFVNDDLDRPTTANHADGGTSTFAYHGLSQSETLSGSGITTRTTSTTKNSQGSVMSATDGLGNTSNYSYHPFGNLAGATSPDGNGAYVNYDIRGNKLNDISPDRGYWSYTYDALGEMLTQTDAKGQTTNLTYDVLGRVTSRSDPTLSRGFSYDSQPHGIGKLATASTSASYYRTEYYDSLSRPAQTHLSQNGAIASAYTTYDSDGRVASKTFPSGFVAGYTYNGAGYLNSITNGVGGAALWTVNNRDAYLNTTQETYGNGVVNNQQYYEATGRINNIEAGPSNSVLYYSYAWDVAGNLTARAEWTLSVGETFTYDTTNRVTGSSIGGTAKSVSYDGDGNITYKSDVGTYNYTAAGSAQPHAIQSITGTVNSGSGYVTNPSYAYDNNGNMLSGGGRSISYTATNQASSMALPGGGAISYQYDTFDQRSQQSAPEGTTVYWNAQGVTSEEYTAAGTGAVTWRSYLSAAGEKIGVMVQPAGGATTPIYFHSDHLGSIVALTNAAGTVIERDDYDPWGKRRNTNGTDDPGDTLTSQTTRGYTGEEHVADVALINLNARMYDPQIGKFMGSDPLVASPFTSQGWNRFAYVGNNPLNATDPTGAYPVWCRDGCGGIVSGPASGGFSYSGEGEDGLQDDALINGGANMIESGFREIDTSQASDQTSGNEPLSSVDQSVAQPAAAVDSAGRASSLSDSAYVQQSGSSGVPSGPAPGLPGYTLTDEVDGLSEATFFYTGSCTWCGLISNAIGWVGIGASATQYSVPNYFRVGSNFGISLRGLRGVYTSPYARGNGYYSIIATFKGVSTYATYLGNGLGVASLLNDTIEMYVGVESPVLGLPNAAMAGVGILGGPVGAGAAVGYFLLSNSYLKGPMQNVVDAVNNSPALQ